MSPTMTLLDPLALRRLGRRVLGAAALALGLAACSTVPTAPPDDAAGREALLATVWSTLGERHVDPPPPAWPQAMARHRAAVLAAPPLAQDPDALWQALDGLAAEWRDAHTRVEGPRDLARVQRHEVVGPGFGLLPVAGQWVATAVRPDSAAHAAGLRDGMALLSWQGESPQTVWARLSQQSRTSSTPQATEQLALRRWLHGASGGRVDTVWARPDAGPLSISVEQQVWTRPPHWSVQRLPSGVTVLRWSHFAPELEAGLTAAIGQLGQQGPDVRGLVLDLRGNGGGNFDMTQRLAAALLPARAEGAIVGRKGEPGASTVLHGRGLYNGPVAVLQDHGSASGSELLARTLQALGRARVVGQVSCGCLLSITRYLPLGPQARLAVSERHIRWADGRVEGVGVQPDLPVERSLAAVQAGRDEVLEAAERWLLQAPRP
ncbi:S41 family peptidase [Ideonella sp. DXS22W]|uniref:S41 family peptidase n=1 Tax=Pseudaquabacterium inlustre TaxID=2984192 RepID=A0ABU9CMY8_9BURK